MTLNVLLGITHIYIDLECIYTTSMFVIDFLNLLYIHLNFIPTITVYLPIMRLIDY